MSLSLYLEPARRSISSTSSSSTAHRNSILSPSECTTQVEEYYKNYDKSSITKPKPLPLLPSSNSTEINSYLTEHPVSHPSQSPIPPLTTVSQLAYALGPDNIPHTTEIDTVPCAGIRIPIGPLTGLLAWRLVVRLASPTKGKRRWWSDGADRRNSYTAPPVQNLQSHTTRAPIPFNPSASMSAFSLPLLSQVSPPDTGSPDDFIQKLRPSSVMLVKQAHFSLKTSNRSQLQMDQTSLSNALTVNFILDTSIPYSIISRDALISLGYPPRLIPSPSISHPASVPQDDKPAIVTLSVQNIPTRFHIARPNEASRLGVQFLHDTGVSVFFGEGVGPVFYVESARLLKDVPRTIPLQGIGTKLTLPQRVRALLRL